MHLKAVVTSIASMLAVGYIAAAGYMYIQQDALTFPAQNTDYIDVAVYDRTDNVRLEISSPNGTLRGIQFNSANPHAPVYVLYGGNQHDVVNFSRYMFDTKTHKQAHVVGVYYPGYGPEGYATDGKPSDKLIYENSMFIFDNYVKQAFPQNKIHLAGYSMGTSPAVYVASKRDVESVTLLGPFNKITEVAKIQYGWLPVDLLMRSQFPTTDFIQDVTEPVSIIIGADDTLIPNHLSRDLADKTQNLAHYIVLPGVHHGELVTAKAAEEALLKVVTQQQ